jgi:RNA polymerase sigma-70 factor (ECF subfamily)
MNTRARFESEVMRHLSAAYNLARWLTRNDADAQDVTQGAALRAFRYFDGFRGGDARVWLLTIVRNTFYSMRAGAPQEHPLEDFEEILEQRADENTPDPEALLLRVADARQLRAALEALPPEHREILVLREFEECSYKEIAAITQLKIGTVMSRLARARERLQRVLGAEASS